MRATTASRAAFNETFRGGLGNDTLTGGVGYDTLDGGEGTDKLVESNGVGFVLSDTGISWGGGSVDPLSGIEVVDLTGGDGANVMNAQNFTGKVTLHGGGGNDHLHGGSGPTSSTATTGTTHLGHRGHGQSLRRGRERLPQRRRRR